MKRTVLLIAALVLLNINTWASRKDIIKKEKGLITFTVDRDLPEPNGAMDKMTNASAIIFRILNDDGDYQVGHQFVASSFSGEQLGNYGRNPFFKGMIDAFADHRPVVLSPDVIWQLICQGFANHVNRNPEEMRHLFVDHEGKIDLVVESGEELYTGNPDWHGIVSEFANQISQNTKDGVAELMAQPFSTTGPDELMASQVVLMKTVESYFEYIVIYFSCGIPSITLTGTPQDWQSILDRTHQLEKYGLGWWVDELDPILKEFVKASKGKPNADFWKSIVKKYRPGEMRGAGCGFDESTELDGWFLKFFPYDRNGRLPEKVRMTHDMLPEQVSVNFKYIILNDFTGEVESITEMEMRAGIMGMEFDTETWTSTPKIGWFVRESKTEAAMLDEIYDKDRTGELELRIDRVPDIFQKVGHLRQLHLHFTGKVDLPQWLESKEIDRLNIDGNMTPEEMDSIKARFPNVRLDRW